jgi:hypothetical protein
MQIVPRTAAPIVKVHPMRYTYAANMMALPTMDIIYIRHAPDQGNSTKSLHFLLRLPVYSFIPHRFHTDPGGYLQKLAQSFLPYFCCYECSIKKLSTCPYGADECGALRAAFRPAIMLGFLDLLITSLFVAISLAILVPLTGGLVRFRANYNPKALRLNDPEEGVQAHTGPIVSTFVGMMRRVYKIEVQDSYVPLNFFSLRTSIREYQDCTRD